MEITNLISSSRQFLDELEKHRAEWESATHWYARKTFLRHNWENFEDKERLICLSTAWANVHFLGNRYPEKVMMQLKTLEQGISNANHLLLEADKQVIGSLESVSVKKDYSSNNKLPKGMIPMRFVKETKDTNNLLNSNMLEEKTITRHDQVVKPTLSPFFNGKPLDVCNKSFTGKKICSFDISNLKSSCDDVWQSCVNDGGKILSAQSAIRNDTNSETKLWNTSLSIAATSSTQLNQIPCLESVSDKSCSSHASITTESTIKEDLQIFARSLSSLVKTELPCISATNRMDLFNRCVQRLKCNPIFKYGYVKKQHVPFLTLWAEQCNRKLDMKCGACVCDVYVPNLFISNGYGDSKTSAQMHAVTNAIQLLASSYIHIVEAKRRRDSFAFVIQYALSTEPVSLDIDTLPPIVADFPPTKQVRFFKPISFVANEGALSLPQEFVLREREGSNAISTINESAQFNQVSFNYLFHKEDNDCWKCILKLNGEEVATAITSSQKESKLHAAECGLKILKATYPTIIMNSSRHENMDLGITRMELLGKTSNEHADKKLGDENIGNKLLRKMGWSGTGGLGKHGNGISEPVKIKLSCGRAGLGNESVIDEKQQISFRNATSVLREFVSNGSIGELTFSSELTQEERKRIHQLAPKYGLASKSYGKGDKRHMIVYKKRDVGQIISDLEESGGQKGGLQLVMPSYNA